MQPEIEGKFTDIDVEAVRLKLNHVGAKLVTPERLLRRRTFDFADKRLFAVGGWVRLRDEGDKVTLAYKQVDDRGLTGTKEASVVVADFEATGHVLEAVGLVQKSYQETRRESWVIDEVQVEIDTWPWLPSFLEIEAPTEAAFATTAQKLGLDPASALHSSIEPVYQQHFDVTDADINTWTQVTFGPVPDWLEARRKP